MWWYGRGNSGGSWLPEEKKANMWPGRGKGGGSWPPAFPRSSDIGVSGKKLFITFSMSKPNLPPLPYLKILKSLFLPNYLLS